MHGKTDKVGIFWGKVHMNFMLFHSFKMPSNRNLFSLTAFSQVEKTLLHQDESVCTVEMYLPKEANVRCTNPFIG